MKVTIAILLLIFLISCGKPRSMYRATLYNPTNHSIKILFYKDGIVNPEDTVLLIPNAQIQIAYAPTGRGSKTGKGRGFNSDHFGNSEDSIVVFFDTLYSITHYTDTPLNLAKNYYLFSSLRNLGNPYSYDYVIIDEDILLNDHKYYFTEQDYLDAKD